jgi:DeoD family purine-nucleoside phosphorylase
MADRRELVLDDPDEAPEPAPGDVFEEDALYGIPGAEAQNGVPPGLDDLPTHGTTLREGSEHRSGLETVGFSVVPIHLRAEPGDYAEACLLPGDPLRAKYIAETYLDDVRLVNENRGLLGYTGSWKGKAVSVQGTGMGCPGAVIVFEELIQLGVTKFLRVGTCGGLQPGLAQGDLIVALSAAPADATATHLVGGEPHCPTSSWELLHEAVHVAKGAGEKLLVGPVVTSDLFYHPDEGQSERWSKRGMLAVEMEAAALFTLGALRGVLTGCLLTVSDTVVEGEFEYLSDEDLQAAVDRLTLVALDTVTAGHGH